MKCEIGDIVFVNSFTYPDGSNGSYHYFVIVAINEDELTLAHLDYWGLVISSQIGKNNDTNKAFPYNEPIEPSEENSLPKKSHVKCDALISIKPDNIFMKLGTVTPAQFNRFMELLQQSLES